MPGGDLGGEGIEDAGQRHLAGPLFLAGCAGVEAAWSEVAGGLGWGEKFQERNLGEGHPCGSVHGDTLPAEGAPGNWQGG
ncbi:MAG: hypothetical protein RJA22_1589 [Verrucomicrobiota bacterium]